MVERHIHLPVFQTCIGQLSDATSYEERAALRQVLRKRKKDRGETNVRTKPRGNSVYNRFAGSTAKSSKSGPAVAKLVRVSCLFMLHYAANCKVMVCKMLIYPTH